MSTTQESYQHYLQRLDDIPSLPSIVGKVLQIINHPNASAADISDYIEKDVGLASKVLKMANSAYYGIPQTISSVRSAIVILGFNTVKSLVLSSSVSNIFNNIETDAINPQNVWKHSVEVSMLSRLFAKESFNVDTDPDIAFSSGLLHDVGLLAIGQCAPKDLEKLVAELPNYSSLIEAEEKVLGVNHLYLGDFLLEKWGLPEALRKPILYHYTPDEAEEFSMQARVIHVANFASCKLGSTCLEAEPVPSLIEESLTAINQDVNEEELLEKATSELENFSEIFNLIYQN